MTLLKQIRQGEIMQNNNGFNDKKIIFVCTGNTCRSCMAEGIFRAVSSEKNDMAGFAALSRGIHAFDGDDASEHSVNALRNLWNIDISLHKAKMLSSDEVLEADLLLTMTRQHRDILKIKYFYKNIVLFAWLFSNYFIVYIISCQKKVLVPILI